MEEKVKRVSLEGFNFGCSSKPFKSEGQANSNQSNQGDDESFDPARFGLKFDKDKADWTLMDMRVIPGYLEATIYLIKNRPWLMVKSHNNKDIYNEIMDSIMEYQAGRGDIDGHHPMLITGSLIAYYVRGRAYSEKDLSSCESNFRWDLIDPNFIEKIVSIYTYGAQKYQRDNWKKVSKERYFSALCRHVKNIITKEMFDGESGFMHMYHAFWNTVAIYWMDTFKKG